MALFEGDNWSFTVTEWWYDDSFGEVFMAPRDENNEIIEPTWEELAVAHTLTAHLEWYDDQGNITGEKYFQLESDDGFQERELEVVVDDAVEGYQDYSGSR